MKSEPSADAWQKLCEHIGLSEYEAKVYVSLITEGAAQARRISMACGVPRTKVYGTLRKLIERGLVLEIPEEPRRFAPAPPADAFEVYLRSFKRKASDLGSVVSSLEGTYEATKETNRSERGRVWVIQGRGEVLRKSREMLPRAEESVDIVTTENGLILLYKACNKLLDKLAERGVQTRIGVPIGSLNRNVTRELGYVCDIKRVDVSSPVLFVGVDGREFLLANLVPDDYREDSDRDVGIFSDTQALCDLVSLLLFSGFARPMRTSPPGVKASAPQEQGPGVGKLRRLEA